MANVLCTFKCRPDARQPASSRKLAEVTVRIFGVQNFEDSLTVAMVYVIRRLHQLLPLGLPRTGLFVKWRCYVNHPSRSRLKVPASIYFVYREVRLRVGAPESQGNCRNGFGNWPLSLGG